MVGYSDPVVVLDQWWVLYFGKVAHCRFPPIVLRIRHIGLSGGSGGLLVLY